MTRAVVLGMLAALPARADAILGGLITRTDNSPFFVKMRKHPSAEAKELGVTF
jgi:ABC-type sugar transport system substrate-binding protein